MTRPITLFTGQWADMPILELVEKASSWGFDGLELACRGRCWAISNHLATVV